MKGDNECYIIDKLKGEDNFYTSFNDMAKDWGYGWDRERTEFCNFVETYYNKYAKVGSKSFKDYINDCTREELLELIKKTFKVLMHEKACHSQAQQ